MAKFQQRTSKPTFRPPVIDGLKAVAKPAAPVKPAAGKVVAFVTFEHGGDMQSAAREPGRGGIAGGVEGVFVFPNEEDLNKSVAFASDGHIAVLIDCRVEAGEGHELAGWYRIPYAKLEKAHNGRPIAIPKDWGDSDFSMTPQKCLPISVAKVLNNVAASIRKYRFVLTESARVDRAADALTVASAVELGLGRETDPLLVSSPNGIAMIATAMTNSERFKDPDAAKDHHTEKQDRAVEQIRRFLGLVVKVLGPEYAFAEPKAGVQLTLPAAPKPAPKPAAELSDNPGGFDLD